MRPRRIPVGARVIRSYSELEQIVSAFFAGHFNLLVILGRAGIAKSTCFQRKMSRLAHRIQGWTAPLQAYVECYENRNKILVFDDAESLWQWPAGRTLFRELCETRSPRAVHWTSTTRELTKAGVPREFTTTSPVAIITNTFAFGGIAETQAILDRGHLVYFDPTSQEVHRQVGTWFWDQEIYDFIGENLLSIRSLSGRTYRKCWELKIAGLDWRMHLRESHLLDQARLLIQVLEIDANYTTVDAKVKRFTTVTGKCRATYFNLRKQLEQDGQLVLGNLDDLRSLRVQGTAPLQPRIEDQVDAAEAESFERQDQVPEPGTTDLDVGGERKRTRAPDEEVRGWFESQLQKAIRDGNHARAEILRKHIRKMEERDKEGERE